MITSTIIWNEDLSKAPEGINLLLWIHDDSGDDYYDYTTMGWKVPNTNVWVADNDQLFTSFIKMWARMPE